MQSVGKDGYYFLLTTLEELNLLVITPYIVQLLQSCEIGHFGFSPHRIAYGVIHIQSLRDSGFKNRTLISEFQLGFPVHDLPVGFAE